jgi:hypothetical protein
MDRFEMDDGAVVDTALAARKWDEDTVWDGRNHIGRVTRSQWERETLYRSSKGRYYLVHTSAYQGTLPTAAWLTPEEAVRWLTLNEDGIPEDLQEAAEGVVE